MKKNTIITIIALIVLAILVSFSVYIVYSNGIEKGEGDVFVLEAIDGDTFKMSDGATIRLLCVDTPEEGEEGYGSAGKFLESLVLYKEVRMEKAESLDDVDKYNRDLRFVYVQNNDKEIFVNQEIIRLGFGEFYDYQDIEGECARTLVQ